MHTTTVMDDGAVLVIDLDPAADWHHSTFPNPLITVDYDDKDKAIKMVVVGELANNLINATRDVLTEFVADKAGAAELTAAMA